MKKIRINKSRFGKGVFATKLIKKDEEILIFTGPIIGWEESEKPPVRIGDPLQIDKKNLFTLKSQE